MDFTTFVTNSLLKMALCLLLLAAPSTEHFSNTDIERYR